MGTISSAWASSHAIATCAGVALWRSATARTRSTIAWLASIASWVNRGSDERKSFGSVEAVAIVPVRKPRPSGAKGMNAASFAAHHGTTSSKRSVNHSESSDCTLATGWIAWARASSSTIASDMPSARTFPAPTSSAMAPHDSSSGTAGSIRWS